MNFFNFTLIFALIAFGETFDINNVNSTLSELLCDFSKLLCVAVTSKNENILNQKNDTKIENNDIQSHKNFRLLQMDICGPIAQSSRIIYGGSARPREFPWMALIAYNTDSQDEQEFKCGGTLITEKFILTAAHCVKDKPILGVRLGEFDISLEKECHKDQNCEPPVQDILIEKCKIHEDFNQASLLNDIALIKLAKPAKIHQENIKPICLPTGDLLKVNILNKFLTVTEWGTTETGYNSTLLNKVAIPVVALRKCRKRYGKAVSKKQICAGGYKGADSCSGDSGGPLQYIGSVGQSKRYIQEGIVSYGSLPCGIDGWPGIYTNVREYIGWILDNIEK